MSTTIDRQPLLLKLNRTHPMPPELGALFDAINAFIAKWDRTAAEPPGWRSLTDILRPLPGKSQSERDRIRLREISSALAEYPAETRRYVGPVTSNNLRDVIDKYWLLEYSMHTLTMIASVNAQPLPDTLPQTPVIDVRFVIDQQTGKLLPQSDLMEILSGIDGENDCRRIRRCLRCGKLFWAGRITKVCCTETCSRVLRARTYRKAHLTS